MKITLEITPKRIADLMVTAIEGNHMTRSWCEGIYLAGAWEKALASGKLTLSEKPWYAAPEIYEGEFTLHVVELVNEDEDDHAEVHEGADGSWAASRGDRIATAGSAEEAMRELNIKTGVYARHIVSRADFENAFVLMASVAEGSHFGDFLAENEDAVTADVFVQLAALKEVRYG